MADRVEVGRHPRAADPARRRSAPLVARRGADHAPLSRDRGRGSRLPDGTVLDGEVLAFRDGRPLPFSALQQRIGRQKQVAQLARAVPVVFMAYDILEHDGDDVRPAPARPSGVRLLEALLGPTQIDDGRTDRSSPSASRRPFSAASWDELGDAARATRARAASKD